MATYTSAEATKCSICMKHISNHRRLPCHDSFCLQCLEHYAADSDAQSGDTLVCPLCTEVFQIPDGGLAALPQDAFVQQLLAKMEQTEDDGTNISCDLCSQECSESGAAINKATKATAFCMDCHQNMCEQCSIYHKRFTGTKQHRTVLGGGKSKQVTQSDRCDKYPAQLMEIYCQDCCAATCLACYFEKHNTHTCVKMNSIVEELRGKIRSRITDMECLVLETHSDEKELKKEYNNILDQIKETELIVWRAKEDVMRCTENNAKELLCDLNYLLKQVSDEFSTKHTEIVKRRGNMEHFSQYSSVMLTEGTPLIVTSVAGEIFEKANKLQQKHVRYHSKRGQRPSVEVSFESLGLATLADAQHNRHPINLLGRVTATIIAPLDDDQQLQSGASQKFQPQFAPTSRLGVGTSTTDIVSPTFSQGRHTGSTIKSANAEVSKLRRRIMTDQKRRHEASLAGVGLNSSQETFSLRGLLSPETLPTGVPGKPEFSDDEEPDSDDEEATHDERSLPESNVGGQPSTIQQQDASTSARQDIIHTTAAIGEVTHSQAEASHSIASDSENKDVIHLFYPAKLYRLKSGTWRDRGVGYLKFVRHRDSQTTFMQMTDRQTFREILAEQIRGDMMLNAMPECDDREWTWISNNNDNDYRMFSLRFTSKDNANSFKDTFDNLQQLQCCTERQARPLSANVTTSSSSV